MTEREYFCALIDVLTEHYVLNDQEPDGAAMARIRRVAASPQPPISNDPSVVEMIYGVSGECPKRLSTGETSTAKRPFGLSGAAGD